MNKRKTLLCITVAGAALAWGTSQTQAQYVPPPALVPGVNYLWPNYANSPILTKFKDALPVAAYPADVAATPTLANGLGQYIPIAVSTPWPETNGTTSDYYEIAIVDYTEQMHSDMPATKIRGYVQIEPPGAAQPAGSQHYALPGITFGGAQVYGYDKPHYMGPLIIATRGKATRIKFYNLLATTAQGGSMFIPTDTSLMGAGVGPNGGTEMYTQNRAVVHLHGGDTPWISDGTLHQWITPAGETTSYPKGASEQSVPDMPVPPSGATTLYFPNGQSGRLLFYHEHAQGLTRLGVYVGSAAGYLLTDATERALSTVPLVGGATAVAPEIPLVIQDRTFVSDGTLPSGWPTAAGTTTGQGFVPMPTINNALGSGSDPTWALNPVWGQTKGSLWYPHVYVPNQNPNDPSGANPFGRWDYGPYFWPVFPVVGPLPQTATGPLPCVVPESFVDTPIINGTAYPTMTVQPTTYRFRILSVGNERYFNLQFYVAEPLSISVLNGGTGYSATPTITINDPTGTGAGATATVVSGVIVGITVTNYGNANYTAPTVTITDTTGLNATAFATANTEVRMIPAIKNNGIAAGAYDTTATTPVLWPAGWTANDTPGMTPNILDNRTGGVPDPSPSLQGPVFVHIGTDGGISPQATVLPNTPIGYEQNKRSVTVLNTYEHTLFLGPAERADVMVDFSAFAGKTLIMYNDAPAPLPAGDPRNDYYTGDPDNTSQGGAPTTIAGFGPNTRTIMQIKVVGTPTAALDVAALNTAVSAAFASSQPVPLVPESAYNPPYPAAADNFARISDTSMTFTPYTTAPEYPTGGGAITVPLQPKTIQELFDPLGRMNATLGVELPFTTATIQTTIPMGIEDPPTEVFPSGAYQLWKITHNGVDTHAIHFHLFNVQVINRVGWDGAIKPIWPEELGWKDTVKMNPLEDIVVALRAKVPDLPFQVPNSVRPLSPANPLGVSVNYYGAPIFIGVDPNGNPVTVVNQMCNFGHEYIWHCHLLGHEENDMMRAICVAVPPATPTLTTTVSKGKLILTWTDTSPDETGFLVQKTVAGVTTLLATLPAGTTTYTDTTYKANQAATYSVIAVNTVGSAVPGYPQVTVNSVPSTAAAPTVPLGKTTITSVTQAVAVASPVVVNWTYSATDQTGFTVQYSTSSTFPNNSTTSTTVAGTVFTKSITITGLKKSTTYYFRVTPTNAVGSGAPSNVASLLVHP